jgi:uncharacterized protein (TIGR02246 family)
MLHQMTGKRVMCAAMFVVSLCSQGSAQASRIEVGGMPDQVAQVMTSQMDAWNQGDLEGFMQGYWRSDSLLFVGKSGITRGHSATLERYQLGYPTQADMGTLTFRNDKWVRVSRSSGWLVGGWHLEKEGQTNAEGMYTLLWKRIHGDWVIVADHSS